MGYEIRLIDRYIDAMCLQAPRSHFYPSAIEKSLHLPLQDVFKRLLQLVSEEILILQWELRCPVYGCADTVGRFDNVPEFGQIVTCHYGHEFKVDANVVFPVLTIHPEYRKFIREEAKKKGQALAPYSEACTISSGGVSLQDLFKNPEIADLLIGLKSILVGGDFVVQYNDSSRTISGSFNNNGNFQGNVNFGDEVKQIGTWGTIEVSKFNELVQAIKRHPDIGSNDKNDAIETLNDLKAKKETGQLRPTFLKKMWETLPEAVRTLRVAGEVFSILHGA